MPSKCFVDDSVTADLDAVEFVMPAGMTWQSIFLDLTFAIKRYFKTLNPKSNKDGKWNSLEYGTLTFIDEVMFLFKHSSSTRFFKTDIVRQCAENRDYNLAAYFAKKFRLNKDKQTPKVQNAWNEELEIRQIDHEEYHALKVGMSPKWVETDEQLRQAGDELKKAAEIFFDTETILHVKPAFVTVIQIASKGNIYLIDALSEKRDQSSYEYFADMVFNNPQILKKKTWYLNINLKS